MNKKNDEFIKSEINSLVVDFDELQTDYNKLTFELEKKQEIIEKYKLLNTDINISKDYFDIIEYQFSNEKISVEDFIKNLNDLISRTAKQVSKSEYAINYEDIEMFFATEFEKDKFFHNNHKIIEAMKNRSFKELELYVTVLSYIDKHIKTHFYFSLNEFLPIFNYDDEEIKSCLYFLFICGNLKMFLKGNEFYFLKTDKAIITDSLKYTNTNRLYKPDTDQFGRIRSQFFLNVGEDKLYSELFSEMLTKFNNCECFLDLHISDGDFLRMEDEQGFVSTLLENGYIKKVYLTKKEWCYIKTGKLMVDYQ